METLVGEAIGIARGGLIIDFIRIIFFLIDAFVYSLCGGFYRVAIGMIDINKFMDTSPILSRFSNLIYSFLAIFMFFKVAFSLLTMIVDPAQIEDKQKGAAKLIQNIFICLALIVAVPAIFNGARELQKIVIDDQIIEKAIYGEGFENDTTYSNVGHKLAIASWSIFLHPSETLDKDAAAKKKWEEAFSLDTASNSGEALVDLNVYLIQRSVTSRYHIVYMWGISTIFGCYLLWTFIKLAIDFAYRSLKLFVLQLISPIAIISFIDPKSGKDGIFAKWTKECIKTYISLFARIFIYALASVILIEFTKEMNKNSSILNIYSKSTYLLAITALIKSGPKIFDNIFGTELSKDSETKFATDMLRGAYGAGAGALLSGGIAGAQVVKGKMTGWNAIKKVGQNVLSGSSKGFEASKKGNIIGVIKAGAGIVGDTKKSFGIDKVDKDHERELKQMEPNVIKGKAHKNAAIARAKGEYKLDSGGNKVLSTDPRYNSAELKGAEVHTSREKPEVMQEFAVGADGKKRNLNGFSFDFSNLNGDAMAEGEYFKYISKAAEIEETGVSENGRKVYINEAYKKMEKALAGMELSLVNSNLSEQTASYNNASNKDDAWKILADKINAEIRKSDPYAVPMSIDIIKNEVCKNFGMNKDAVSDSQLFKTSVEHFNKISTGHTSDEWQNISGKASNDADAASDSIKIHEATAEGIRDAHRRKTYGEEKGIIESLASKAADRNRNIDSGRS